LEGLESGKFEIFSAIWYILSSFDIAYSLMLYAYIFAVLVCCTKKKLATAKHIFSSQRVM
jgi:hypothetical protein